MIAIVSHGRGRSERRVNGHVSVMAVVGPIGDRPDAIVALSIVGNVLPSMAITIAPQSKIWSRMRVESHTEWNVTALFRCSLWPLKVTKKVLPSASGVPFT